MNIKEISESKKCTGCRACEQSCPKRCIALKPDAEGFLYPVIDDLSCIDCGLCAKSCSVISHYEISDVLAESIIYAAQAKDEQTVLHSSSGGMFTLLNRYVFDQGGTVFGCVFDEEFKVKHTGTKNWKIVHMMRGSKYVQSNTENTYSEVKILLENGEYVLYSGTPCQIAGLKTFLKRSYDKLFTVDLICHGVPSPALFSKYLEWLQQKNKGIITGYEFRNKEKYGWSTSAKIVFRTDRKEKKLNVLGTIDPYYASFLQAKNYRECCYSCKYANPNREGDLTIADYWGLEIFHPDFAKQSSKGCSLILVNTKKAEKILPYLESAVNFIPSKLEWASVKNGNLVHPAKRPSCRDDFYIRIQNFGFDIYAQEFYKSSGYFKARIKCMVPNPLKRIIKNIMHFFKLEDAKTNENNDNNFT